MIDPPGYRPLCVNDRLGDLLGGEQSGFINDIGFDTYQKILNEAIQELKENEFKEIRASKKKRKSTPNNDPRRIGIGSQILRDLGVKKIKLMGSEVRYPSLSGFDLEVTEYIKK